MTTYTFSTTAKSSLGTFPVTAEVTKTQMGVKLDLYIEIKGKKYKGFASRKPGEENVLMITQEIANALNITFKRGMAMRCNLKAARAEYKAQVKALKEAQNAKFDGSTVNSGYGFSMKNTKRNWSIVNRMGYDAIEHVS